MTTSLPCAYLPVHLEFILAKGVKVGRGGSTMEEHFWLHKQEEIIEQKPDQILTSTNLHVGKRRASKMVCPTDMEFEL